MDCLQIKYRNSCDLGGSVFQKPEDPFYYVFYFDLGADVGEPQYEIIEEGREDGEKNVISDFKKLTERYNFTTVVPEYQLDALCAIMLHDTIYIRLKTGERNRVFNFKVEPGEWPTCGMNKVTVSFTVTYDIVTGCCNNEIISFKPCLACNTQIADVEWVDVNDTTQWTDRTYVMRGITDLVTLEKSDNLLYYYRYSTGYNGYFIKGKAVGGLYIGRDYELICYTHAAINYQFYYLNGFWHLHKVIRSAVAVGANVTVRCWSAPNLFAQLYKSFGGGIYTAIGSPVLASQIQNIGVVASGCAAGNNSFKVNLFDNNCDYGYSNVVVVAV